MFPLNWNIPFIRKNGSRTTLGAITGDIAGIEEDVAGVKEDVDELTDQTSALWDTIGQNGAKNLLPFDLAKIKAWNTSGTWNNNVYTLNGVTFTFDSDGIVTVNGKASANAELDYILDCAISGNFILSDELVGVPSNYWAFAKVDGDSSNLIILDKAEKPVSISSSLDYFRIKIFSGKTVSNITFKPMLRHASDTDPTFQPYAKTNRELTEEFTITDHWEEAKIASKHYFSGSYMKKYGSIVTLSFSVSDELPASTDTKVLELPAGCRPAGNFIIPAYINGIVNGHAWVRANGDVEINPTTAGTYLGFTTTFIATQ